MVKQENIDTAVSVVLLQKDIDKAISIGDALFNTNISDDVIQRNHELNKEKTKLIQDKTEKKRIIKTHERIFSDIKKNIDEVESPTTLHVLEDYTLMFLCISYLFMLCMCFGFYIYTQEFTYYVVTKAIVASILITIFLGMTLYIIA